MTSNNNSNSNNDTKVDNNNYNSLDFILKECDKLANQLKDTIDFNSPTVWRKRGSEFGLTKVDLPKLYGGHEFKVAQVIKIYQHLGKLSLNLRDVIGGAHVRSLINSENPSDQSEYSKQVIKSVCSGDSYVAIVITEPSCGSDFEAMKSYSIKDENGDFTLTGEKRFNARLKQATHIILYVLDGKDGNAINVFLLPIGHYGLEILNFEALGLLGNSFGGLKFNGMHVSKEYLIGKQGDGESIFQKHFLYWRLVQSAAAIGTAKGALDQAAKRMIVRETFGGPIGRFTHLQQDLAQHTAKIEMSTLLVNHIAEMFDNGAPISLISSYVPMAKAEVIEFALSACNWSMDIHGAEGYSSSFTDLSQRVCDLLGLRIADGTTQIMRSQVVRNFYDDRFWKWSISVMESNANKKEGHPAKALNCVTDRKNSFGNSEAFIKYVDDIHQSGGPCATLAVVNSIQIICSMFKMPLIDVEKVVQDSYQHDSQLSKGRLTNLQVLQLFNYLANKYIAGIEFDTSVDFNEYLLSQCMNKFRNVINQNAEIDQPTQLKYISKKWNDLDSGILLTPEPYQVKIIAYNVLDGKGILLGRHFVILIDHQDNIITVLDSNCPNVNSKLKLSRLVLVGDKCGGSSISLESLNGAECFQMIINTIFTFNIRQSNK